MTTNNHEILKRSKVLMKEIHKMTELLSKIPIFGDTTQVSQPSGNCHKKHYNKKFIKNLVSDLNASQCNNHLETLFEKGHLTPENLYAALRNKLERLCSILNGFNQLHDNETIYVQ